MNWGDIKTLARAEVPYAKTSVISDTVMELMLYKGVVDIARRTKCLPKNIKFNLTAETQEYLISAITSNFLLLDKPGIWWYDGTDYRQLDPVTKKWLDENIPNWRTEQSDDPQYYYQEQNTIGFYPKPDTSTTDGAWMYYFAKPAKPTTDNEYAFEGSTEIPALVILEDAMIEYFRWKVLKALSKDKEAVASRQEYFEEINDKRMLLKARPDISASTYTKLQGRFIGL